MSEAAAPDRWEEDLIVNDKGRPLPVLANAITALRSPPWRDVLQFDAFGNTTVLRGRPPWTRTAGPDQIWQGTHDLLTAEWLQHQGIYVSPEIAGQAVEVVAQERRFHPVRDYLARCEWDGTARLGTLLPRYFGTDDTLYEREVGRRFMISAIARVSQPGVKVDHCVILEGEQGIRKSSALRVLSQPWFADEVAELGSKDSALQIAGIWILELAELDRMTRAEVGRIKAWMSRSVDRFRPPYAKRVIELARQCVFAGTVNMNDYLRDETGGRRFWPVACRVIDIELLALDRDQLWAEARELYEQGEAWWLESYDLQAAAELQQSRRYQGDPWEGEISKFVRREDGSLKQWVTLAAVLRDALGIPKERWSQTDQNRVARCLRSIGWHRVQKRFADGRREWRYRPSDGMAPVSPDDED